MQTTEERIEEIKKEIRETPYHKATEHHIGLLKARIAKLEEEIFFKNGKSSGGGGGYFVKKSGNATVVMVGPPSVGKSTLLNQLTNAESKIGAYDFTTLNVIPGMMEYRGAKIQIFDVPGIVKGAASGKGRGKEVLAVARNANLVIIMLDIYSINRLENIIDELYEAGIRLNENKPHVKIVRQSSGGIKINATTTLTINYETIKELAREFRLSNAEIIIKENLNIDRLVDAFMGNRSYLPFIVVVNKADLKKNLKNIKTKYGLIEPVYISATNGFNLDYLREIIWNKLEFIRVYLKNEKKSNDNEPYIIKKGMKLNEILGELFITDKEMIKHAKIFGPGSKFPGQEVSLTFVPQDQTIVEFLS